MFNTQEMKRSFAIVPGKQITPDQEKIITHTGEQLQSVLSNLENKVSPEFYGYLQHTFLGAQSAVTVAVSAGWKQNNY